MPEMDGFQLLKELRFRGFNLIITTAYDNYAITAFKENAVDYLLKPIDSDDLKRAVSKMVKQKEKQGLGFELDKVIESIRPPANRRIPIPLSGKTLLLIERKSFTANRTEIIPKYTLKKGGMK